MARDTLRVSLTLDHIHCFDEGDGWGNAEPYLWTVFFKVDGSNVHITDSLNLAGSVDLETTPGSHGNLGTTDVGAGDNVAIPSAIGSFETTLAPIAVPPPFNSAQADVGGVVGCVCVLMEEDNVSDDGAEAGHHALDQAVRDAVNAIIGTLSLTHQNITDADIQPFIDGIKSKVEDAVKNQQNFFENLWSWLNPDDTIGTKVFLFKHDDLASQGTISFSNRWPNEGDWQIFGSVTATVACPASAAAALSSFFASFVGTIANAPAAPAAPAAHSAGAPTRLAAGSQLEKPLAAMRDFRGKEFVQTPGLASWWQLAERHAPQVALASARDREVAAAVGRLLNGMPDVLAKRDTPLTADFLRDAESVLQAVRKSGSRKAKVDASRALSMLGQVRGKSFKQATELLASVRPARHPRSAAGPRVQVPRLKK